MKIHKPKDTIVCKSIKLQDKLDTPDLWSTVGELEPQMEEQKSKGRINIKEAVDKLSKSFDFNMKQYKDNALAGAKDSIPRVNLGLII